MKISEAKDKGVFKTVIHIGSYFGVENEEVWVKMREPNTQEVESMKAGATAKDLAGVVRACIYDHNFVNDQNKPAENEEVFEVLNASADLFMHVVQRWQDELPLLKKTGDKSAK